MQIKILQLFVAFVFTFSLEGFSQSTENTDHPLLDKYYPQPKKVDTNKVITNQIKTMSGTRPIAGGTNVSVLSNKPGVTNIPTLPDTTAVINTPLVNGLPAMTTAPSMTATTSVNKPTSVTAEVPIQKVQPQSPPPPPYMDTRLGSSTKQYDTWEKNDNGAGAVTTSPK